MRKACCAAARGGNQHGNSSFGFGQQVSQLSGRIIMQDSVLHITTSSATLSLLAARKDRPSRKRQTAISVLVA